MIWAAIIVAAGRGTRFGRPKQFIDVAGAPLVSWSIAAFGAMPEISDVIVVTEPEYVDLVEPAAAGRLAHATLHVVTGGADRQASVQRGLDVVPPRCAGVLVHDGARPLIQTADVRAGMRVVRPGVAALLAVPVIDTVKVVGTDGRVRATLDRSELWAAQTPQFATARDLQHAHRIGQTSDAPRATDDAALLERAGVDVMVVQTRAENFKVTLPEDLVRAEAILRDRAPVVDEEEVLLVECYVIPGAVDDVLAEFERRGARVDGIDRDLPNAVSIRAYATAGELRGFGVRLHALAGEDAIFTTHVSHMVKRT